MLRIIFWIISLLPIALFAAGAPPSTGINPPNSWWRSAGWNEWWIPEALSYAERFLLQAVLPLAVVWVALYVGYHLVTASGDEEKMKKAFKSLTFGAIGLIAIACAYAFVAILARLSI